MENRSYERVAGMRDEALGSDQMSGLCGESIKPARRDTNGAASRKALPDKAMQTFQGVFHTARCARTPISDIPRKRGNIAAIQRMKRRRKISTKSMF